VIDLDDDRWRATRLALQLPAERSGWDQASHPREPSGKFAEVPGLDLVASKGKRKGISHNTITAKQWGQKVGHIRLTGEGTEIDDLTVSPKHRGKGIAHRLMQEAIRQHGHNTMRLHASPFGSGGLDSEGLMAFYAKHGFVPEPDRGKGYMVRHPSGGRSAESDGEARGWDEALHPRAPEGSGSGGQFMAYDKSKNQGTGYGKKGGDANVRELQEALNKLGFTDAKGNKLAVDGQLGPLTTAAIMKAQKQLGIKPDGKVDKALLDKIKAMHAPGKPAAHQDHSKAKPGGHPPAAHEDHKGGQPHKPAAHEDHSKAKPKPHGPSAHQDVKGPGDGKFHNAPAHHKPKHKAGPASAHSEVDTGKPKAKPPAKKKPAKPEPPHYQHVEVRPGDRGWWPDDADERASKWTEGKHPRNPDGKFAHLSTAQLAHELGKTNYQLNEPSNQIGAMQKALQAKHKALKTELNKRPDKPAKIPEWTPGTKFTGDAGSPKPATPTPAAPPKPVVPAAPVEPAAPAPKYDLPEYKPKPPKRMPESKTGVSNADEMDLDRDQRKAVREYSGGRYRDVNYTLRGKDWTYSDTQEIIDGLDAVFDKGAKVDRPMTVKRRVMGARLMLGEPGEKVGKTFTDPAFVSTTELADMKNIQGVFGHDEFEIHLPEGTPAFRMGKLSKNTHEKEILLKRGTKFKVLSDKQTPQGRRIKLEVVL
jgi:GNAT superfamily N-acetyltransferase